MNYAGSASIWDYKAQSDADWLQRLRPASLYPERKIICRCFHCGGSVYSDMGGTVIYHICNAPKEKTNDP